MPKRKAPEDFSTVIEPSPPKRVAQRTRSAPSPNKATRNNRLAPEDPVSPKVRPATPRSRRTRRNSCSPENQTVSHNFGRPTQVSTPHRRQQNHHIDMPADDEPDELDLLPPKRMQPSTPAPRLVLDCVEIASPTRYRAKTCYPASPVPGPPASTKGGCIPLPRPPVTPSRKANVECISSAEIPEPVLVPSTPSKGRSHVSPQKSPSRLHRTARDAPTTPSRSPAKTVVSGDPGQPCPRSPRRIPQVLPPHLRPCLRLQQRAILASLHSSSIAVLDEDNDGQSSANATAYRQLQDLLLGSVSRGEGNSCLLLGPRGSGKTSLIEYAIESLPGKPIVIRLSGHLQHNARLALREVARQLSLQTDRSLLAETDDNTDQEHNPFLDSVPSTSLPPPSHLPALISMLPTFSRPTIVILDAFDLFAHHARQSLLYCLLDTVQGCRVGQGSKGLAVVGVTSRLDTINLLEKRVKSRFSGRVLRTAPPVRLHDWISLSRKILCAVIKTNEEEWEDVWRLAVEKFLDDRKVIAAMTDAFALTRDIRMLQKVLIRVVVELRPASPFPTLPMITSALEAQWHPQFLDLHLLSYPSICLLIAAMHAKTAGHDVITFEMLHETFKEQLRASAAAPVHIEGGGIGMTKCTRGVLMSAFEQLLATGMFLSVAAPSVNVAPEFVRYRCLVEREAVKRAVDILGQTSLKKWFYKA